MAHFISLMIFSLIALASIAALVQTFYPDMTAKKIYDQALSTASSARSLFSLARLFVQDSLKQALVQRSLH